MYQAKAFAATSATEPLAGIEIPRREPTPSDVQIEILFCGVCHSDLHLVLDQWSGVMPTVYPIVPGHEIIGRVVKVGESVSKAKVGDIVGVGCLVDSDGTCQHCKEGHEQFCANSILTYNSPDKHGTAPVTYGGYSESVVVDERFVVHIPGNLDLAGAAPLLCAGITTYSPLKAAGVKAGMKVGVVGLGGLGHMAVKLAKAMGAEVWVFTTSPSKKEDALRLGADGVILSKVQEEMDAASGTFDYILNTVSAKHDIDGLLGKLKVGGTMTLVGAPDEPHELNAFALLFGNRKLTGSAIGGLPETQEMLDFCGKHNITADVEVIKMQEINEAYERLKKADVKYRFSIDMASLKS